MSDHDWLDPQHVIAAVLGQIGTCLEELAKQNPDLLSDYLAGRCRLMADRYGVDVLVAEVP